MHITVHAIMTMLSSALGGFSCKTISRTNVITEAVIALETYDCETILEDKYFASFFLFNSIAQPTFCILYIRKLDRSNYNKGTMFIP